MSGVPLKRLYKELPVWIVEDHHDVSLPHFFTRSCQIYGLTTLHLEKNLLMYSLEAHKRKILKNIVLHTVLLEL